MRPNSLIIEAFGPYKTKEMLNFDALAPHNLFVITGKTGAGKTSIFDAISYALYGIASGSDRHNPKKLRSDFVDEKSLSSINFTFTHMGARYRVFRQLPYLKEGNKSETAGKTELFRINAEGKERPAVDRQITSEVNKKIQELLGINYDQFCQLIMLPQGESERFLTSSTANKEVILRTLFNTERYEKLTAMLKIKRDKIHENLKILIYQKDHVLHEINTLPKRDDETIAEANEPLNLYQALQYLTKEASYLNELLIKEQEAHQKNEYERLKIIQRISEEKIIAAHFAERSQCEEEHKALKKREADIRIRRAEIALAKKAHMILPYFEFLEIQQKNMFPLQQERENITKERDQALKEQLKAQERLRQEHDKEAQREALQRALYQLEAQKGNVTALKYKKEQKERLKTIAHKAECAYIEAQHQQKILIAAIELKKNTLKKLQNQCLRHSDIRAQLPHKERQIELIDAVHSWNKALKQAQLQEQSGLDQWNAVKVKHQPTIDAWQYDVTQQLKSHLKKGQPCPVCGHNVHKSVHQESLLLEGEPQTSLERYQEAQHAIQEAEKVYQRQQLETQHAAKEAEKAEKAEKAAHTVASLGFTENRLKLKAEYQQLKMALTALSNVQADYSLLEKNLEIEEKSLETLTQKSEQWRQEYQEAEQHYQKTANELAVLMTDLSEDLHDLDAFNQKIHEKREALTQLKEALTFALTQENQWEKRYLELNTHFTHAEKNLTAATQEVVSALAQFNAQLLANGFKDQADFLQAKRDNDNIMQQEIMIQEHNEAINAVQQRIEALTLLLHNKPQPDIQVLEITLTTFDAEQMQAQQRLFTYKEQLNKIMQLTKNSDRIRQTLTQEETSFGEISQLYDLLRGENTLKLSFERYIQIEYLDQIIEAANLHLSDLSNNQFEFIRSETIATRNVQSGLDLDIHDAYTGMNRDVKTLSGGEKFKASLCLSLGMSDIVQRFKGGIAIDTLFIDEGFGALDEESLQQAIEVLISLHKTGRMIGVISHVEELKSAFPVRIDVHKTREGYSHITLLSNHL